MTQLALFAPRPSPEQAAPLHSGPWWSWVLSRAEATSSAWNEGVAAHIQRRWGWV